MKKFILKLENFYLNGTWFLLWLWCKVALYFTPAQNIFVVLFTLLGNIFCTLSILILAIKQINHLNSLQNLTECMWRWTLFFSISNIWWQAFTNIEVYPIFLGFLATSLILTIIIRRKK